MVQPRGKTTKGRQRIPMERVGPKDRRQVTFSKRKSGLWKKASELSLLCGARIAVVAFSEAGKVFGFGDPSVDDVLRRHVPLPGDAPAADDGAAAEAAHREALTAMWRATKEKEEEVKAEMARLEAVGERVVQAQGGRQFWWEADVDALGPAELEEFAKSLKRLRDNVRRRAETKRSSTPPPPPQQEQ